MRWDEVARRALERRVRLARPVFILLALVDVALLEPAAQNRVAAALLIFYLLVALRFTYARTLRASLVPLTADVLALLMLVFATRSAAAFWFFAIFVFFEAGAAWGLREVAGLAVFFAVLLIARRSAIEPAHLASVVRWAALGAGAISVGVAMALMGQMELRESREQEFLEHIVTPLRVEIGLAESMRQVLDEVAREFDCPRACIVVRDDELERIFMWKVSTGSSERIIPETQPLTLADAYLAGDLEHSICWNSLEGTGEGFGWNRRTRVRLPALPPPPSLLMSAFGAQSLLAVTLETAAGMSGRVILVRSPQAAQSGHQVPQPFSPADLRWLERIVNRLAQPLHNVFSLRHLRAHAIEAERSRISRDLHDGTLQTLLSLNIQLDVLRHKLAERAEPASAEIAALQKTVQHESEELRRLVTGLRPLSVDSADLPEMMYAFAERFRNEQRMEVDLFVDGGSLRIPDRVCREIFNMYREALHNIKKHAHATHIVVKLGQDDAKAFLIVDDNGQGFSFAGKYASEELDELRLGPISIKERVRGVGGTLTVESSPSHGARLTIEIPLS